MAETAHDSNSDHHLTHEQIGDQLKRDFGNHFVSFALRDTSASDGWRRRWAPDDSWR